MDGKHENPLRRQLGCGVATRINLGNALIVGETQWIDSTDKMYGIALLPIDMYLYTRMFKAGQIFWDRNSGQPHPHVLCAFSSGNRIPRHDPIMFTLLIRLSRELKDYGGRQGTWGCGGISVACFGKFDIVQHGRNKNLVSEFKWRNSGFLMWSPMTWN